MTKTRVEAFSDGVIAVIITVILLEFKAPNGVNLAALAHLWPEFGTYVLSFIMLGIYWNNHHHMFSAVKHVSGSAMWANLHLLFWLSLLPFSNEWVRDSNFQRDPILLLGFVLLMCAISYTMLAISLVKVNGTNSMVSQALGNDFKGKASLSIYALALIVCFWFPYVSIGLYVLVALVWFVPDRRFTRVHLAAQGEESE